MDNVKIFNNEEFGSIRTLTINGEPWFVGKDIAEKLGYSNASKAVIDHVDNDDKQKKMITAHSQNGNVVTETTFINESGLYSLILSSKLPNAKRFKHWITSEVLPSIRKTGSYSVIAKLDSYMIEDPVERANRWIEEYKEKQLLIEENIEMKPKAEYYDDIVDRQLNLNFRDTAKEIGVKVNAFTNTLREKKYIYKDRYGNIKPYAQYVNNLDRTKNYFVIKEFCNNGHAGNQTLITPEGRNYFRKQFNK